MAEPDAKFEKGLLLVLRARRLQGGDATLYMLRSIRFQHISMAVGTWVGFIRAGRYIVCGDLLNRNSIYTEQIALPLQRQHFGESDLGVLSWGDL